MRLTERGILETGKEIWERTEHFDVDLEALEDLSKWFPEGLCLLPVSPPSPNLGGPAHKSEALGYLTTHRNGIGDSRVRILASLLRLGGTARAKEIAGLMMIESTNLSRRLKDMEEGLVVKRSRGVYGVPEDLGVVLHNARVAHGEFERDEKLGRLNIVRRIMHRFFYEVLDVLEQTGTYA